ncbi:MAG: CoA-binding protein, partial [Syntrophobacterales bacterium]|nr:CoA-binding protein [Syntrophobacterales bacterium]
MDFFFNPQSIAIVGATPNRAKGGNAIIRNLDNAFQGVVYPVNPKYREIEGRPCYPSIRSLPAIPDLAILFIGAEQTVSSVEECVKKGIPGVIIESGGFSEAGERGKELQRRLAALAQQTGIRIWGPNCMGLVDVLRGHVFSFTDPLVLKHLLKAGPLSMVVQSGMLSAGFLVDLLSHEISGFSKICSIGNKTDVDECDLLQYLLQDTTTEAIAFYLESFHDLRRFVSLYQEHRPQKPVVVLKGGKSDSGAQAALSHTASIAGNSRIAEDILREGGIVTACDFHQMIDLCRTLEMTAPLMDKPRKNAAILTFSGASGIVASDFMAKMGLNVPSLTEKTTAGMSAFFPPWMPPANPVDLWPAIEHHSGKNRDIYIMALEAVLADEKIDACMIHSFIGFSRIHLDLEAIALLVEKWRKPVFIWAMGEKEKIISFRRDAWRKKIPFFHELHRAVECMAASMSYQPAPPPPSSIA